MNEIEEQENRITQNDIMRSILKEEGAILRRDLKLMKKNANKNKTKNNSR